MTNQSNNSQGHNQYTDNNNQGNDRGNSQNSKSDDNRQSNQHQQQGGQSQQQSAGNGDTSNRGFASMDADRQREIAVANAYRDAQKVKGQGDAEATAVYAEAFGKDPKFAQFYRSLEAYKASFTKKSDVMVLDPASSDFFKAFQGAAPAQALPRK